MSGIRCAFGGVDEITPDSLLPVRAYRSMKQHRAVRAPGVANRGVPIVIFNGVSPINKCAFITFSNRSPFSIDIAVIKCIVTDAILVLKPALRLCDSFTANLRESAKI